MKLKELDRTAALAWTPTFQSQPLIAAGTLAGAVDASFSTSAELEIFGLNLSDTTHEAVRLGSASAPGRFKRVAWSSFGIDSDSRPSGIIAGGLENGILALYDAAAILDGKGDAAALVADKAHEGAISGLDFNPFNKNVLATGAQNAEIFIWDLNDPTRPYTPGAPSGRLSDIACLAWNRQVAHILASGSPSGSTVVWDLKNRREVIHLVGQARTPVTAIAWNPEESTQILTASEDHNMPYIYAWDLRNAHAPVKVLKGHNRGVLSIAWCPYDSSLLLSCGQDNRTILWNPLSGEALGELPVTKNWSFDVQWCPHNPDLISVASFDGKITVHSLQGAQNSSETSSDPFSPHVKAATLTRPPKWLRRPCGASFSFGGRLVTFGSRKAVLSHPPGSAQAAHAAAPEPPKVNLLSVVTENSVVTSADSLEHALEAKDYLSFCKVRMDEARSRGDAREENVWKFLRILFERDARRELLAELGFDAAELAKRVEEIAQVPLKAQSDEEEVDKSTKTAEVEAEQAPVQQEASQPVENTAVDEGSSKPVKEGDDVSNLFGAPGASDSFDISAVVAESAPATLDAEVSSSPVTKTAQKAQGKPFKLYPASASEVDNVIVRAIALGDFGAAVDACLRVDRTTDALLFAICGGADLLHRTQEIVLNRSSSSYARVLSCVVKGTLQDVVENGDLKDWEEILAILCTYAKPDDFSPLCDLLASRLELDALSRRLSSVRLGTETHVNEKEQALQNSVLCYMAAGNFEKVIQMWISKEDNLGSAAVSSGRPLSPSEANTLQTLIEKVALFARALEYVEPEVTKDADGNVVGEAAVRLAPLYERYAKYAELLAEQGRLKAAMKYISLSANRKHVLPTLSAEPGPDPVAILADRIYRSGGQSTGYAQAQHPPFPFEYKDYFAAAAAPIPEPTQPQHAQHQPQQVTQQPIQHQPISSIPQQPVSSIPQHHQPIQQQTMPSYQTQQPYGYGAYNQPPPPLVPVPSYPQAPSSTGYGYPAPSDPATNYGYVNTPTPTPPPTFPQPGYGNQGYGAPPTIPAPGVAFPNITERPNIPPPSQNPNVPGWNDPPMIAMRNAMPAKPSIMTPPAAVNTSGSVTPPAGVFVPQQPAPPAGPPMGGSYRGPTGAYAAPPNVLQPGLAIPPTASGINQPVGGPAQQAQAPVPPKAAVQAPPAKQRHPLGDRSHIPKEQLPIVTACGALLKSASETGKNQRVVGDASKRFDIFFDRLNNGEVSANVIPQILELATAIEQRDWHKCDTIRLALTTTAFDELGAWLMGVKWLVEMVKM